MRSVPDRQFIAYRAGLDRLPFHWCQLAPRHRTAHQCQCGAEFITEEEKGDAWEATGGLSPSPQRWWWCRAAMAKCIGKCIRQGSKEKQRVAVVA